MGLIRKFMNQTRKPEGKLGKMMIKGMNSGHAKMADWGMAHLLATSPEKVVDLGCGGGRNIGALLQKYPGSKGTAVDHSDLSVEKAKEFNSEYIKKGRLEVKQGDVSALDLPDDTYDIATAFETIYFWPGLEKCFGEVCRILRNGGSFLIVNECDGEDMSGQKYEKIVDGMKCYTTQQISEALQTAGFTKVVTDRYQGKPWILVIGVK
ncbi:MAG: class I SAM-dependent methyltransferase [Lachnospiraceae bacterium]|nr:class I SAM-dependent methyltransferase [Lachnospiraceae bacterium]